MGFLDKKVDSVLLYQKISHEKFYKKNDNGHTFAIVMSFLFLKRGQQVNFYLHKIRKIEETK